MPFTRPTYYHNLKSLDELLERDRQREKDGFPRKIRIGRLVRPGKGGDKVVVVPSTVEEKFIHDTRPPHPQEEQQAGGAGEGEEGDVIGRQPIHQPGGTGQGAGQGQGEGHDVSSNAYDLGKILTEKFQLPNLQDKGKKRSLTKYTYDLTDRNRGAGQLLDKKATLRQILKTNIALGIVNPGDRQVDPGKLMIGPRDRIYRTLSREQDYESQALVFFMRDYSASMSGKPTEIVVSQHLLIYSWLMFQYKEQVESRFLLHDTEAKEVRDFNEYYNSTVAGGTRVAAVFRLVNEIVRKESLARDYNIYVFYGTDGEDWDSKGEEVIRELREMLTYVSRIGISVVRPSYARSESAVEKYMKESGLLEEKSDYIRMDTLQQDASESRVIEGIREIVALECGMMNNQLPGGQYSSFHIHYL